MKNLFAKIVKLNEEIEEKLFLCSKDIQVGDTFIDSVGRIWENSEACWVDAAMQWNKAKYNNLISGNTDSITNRKSYAYKIIGEISSEATWVQDGDEFEESEILKFSRVKDNQKLEVGIITRNKWGDRVKILTTEMNEWACIKCEFLDEAELNTHPSFKKGGDWSFSYNDLMFIDRFIYKIYNNSCKHFH